MSNLLGPNCGTSPLNTLVPNRVSLAPRNGESPSSNLISVTPCETEAAAAKRNHRIFEHYGEGRTWREILDNGFGKSYRRDDGERFALWSYTMDITTVGTMAFHEVKWR